MRQALCEEFASLPDSHVVSMVDERFPSEPTCWTTVRVGPGQVETMLAQLSRLARYSVVVAPETDGLLAQCASAVEHGWIGSSPEAIHLCSDKAKLADHLRSRGLRVPDHWIVHEGDPWPPDAPDLAVLKPIDGAGSLDTSLRTRSERLDGFSGARLLQPYVCGTSLSASFLVDARGRSWLVGVGAQKHETDEAGLHYQGGLVPRGDVSWAEEAARAVESVPGLLGWVGVDFQRDESGACTILEINPRVTTSLVGLRACLPSGTIARVWLNALLGEGQPLAHQVHSQPTVQFDTDGRISVPGGCFRP